MNYLFTSESVSEGHPDKVADQISDAVLDEFLRQDPHSKVACETFCSTGLVVVGGEVLSDDAYVDIQKTARDTILRIGYDKADYMFDGNSCGVLSAIHEQSQDINRGVVRENPDEQGAGDQGMMFGYACRDTEDYMPLPLYLSHVTLQVLADIRHNQPKLMPYLRPDAKSQFTIEYDGETNRPVRVHTIVISTQHDEFVDASLGKMSMAEAVEKYGSAVVDKAMHDKIEKDVKKILIPRIKSVIDPHAAALFKDDFILHVNPTGKFVIGGPHGDTGLTGRKIIVDTYGGKGAHGGGAFSGKDPSKVDRSAAYAARYIAKNLVAAGVADQMLVQVAYAIGVARPVSISVNTYGTANKDCKAMAGVAQKDADAFIARKIEELFDLRPAAIIRKFELTNPIYEPTAAYGHFGRKPYSKKMTLIREGKEVTREVRFFTWEELDSVGAVRKSFGI
ncbi:MAG: methionine adenosyltransferase [Bacteroidales bacterium]|nr:methionine adenosyltransferase [Bacteroidales bacterium]